ncbi:hypothetical protein DFH07DRAFT_947631 [Mycena maculata]|uniref:Uncharacterized protein n=1 Tax=Mycena maculata TaxID=230809 RepID=A0AAD7MHA9_9AGAR|nr:hypothetical protein DFH07DRAFT_947631 [Mycena maculata]
MSSCLRIAFPSFAFLRSTLAVVVCEDAGCVNQSKASITPAAAFGIVAGFVLLSGVASRSSSSGAGARAGSGGPRDGDASKGQWGFQPGQRGRGWGWTWVPDVRECYSGGPACGMGIKFGTHFSVLEIRWIRSWTLNIHTLAARELMTGTQNNLKF